MSVKKTEERTKKFTKSEKLSIMKKAKLNGVMVTLSKYDLYPATYYYYYYYYYWKRKFTALGEDGLDHQKTKNLDKENKRLEKENERLKRIIGEKGLESALKDEMLKKVSRQKTKTLVPRWAEK